MREAARALCGQGEVANKLIAEGKESPGSNVPMATVDKFFKLYLDGEMPGKWD
jgi:hypothetical protein